MAKGYNFFFDKVQLPVAPESMEMKINNQNTTINLINDQEVNILKRPGLTEITFEALIPQMKYPFASYPNGFRGAAYFLDAFEKLKISRKPFQFIVSRATPNGKLLFDTNIKVSLEEYTISEDAGEGFDIKVSFTLKQYVDYGTKTVKITIKEILGRNLLLNQNLSQGLFLIHQIRNRQLVVMLLLTDDYIEIAMELALDKHERIIREKLTLLIQKEHIHIMSLPQVVDG